MNITDVGTAVLAICAAAALFAAVISWFFRRGADEREFSVALRENTKATLLLSGDFRSFRDHVTERLHAHDMEIERLKYAPPPIQVTTKVEAPSDDRSSPYRDASPARGH